LARSGAPAIRRAPREKTINLAEHRAETQSHARPKRKSALAKVLLLGVSTVRNAA